MVIWAITYSTTTFSSVGCYSPPFSASSPPSDIVSDGQSWILSTANGARVAHLDAVHARPVLLLPPLLPHYAQLQPAQLRSRLVRLSLALARSHYAIGVVGIRYYCRA
ncbi:unnamed protein product [Toxocara canis]|uniref:Secreted protein n=1 Tax=Toxocara canis TaxID=6265 RepID=A0A183UCN1_TOXCA|nr:unnamed protein product [Toxocara canis]